MYYMAYKVKKMKARMDEGLLGMLQGQKMNMLIKTR
jgi:hypothetical protein